MTFREIEFNSVHRKRFIRSWNIYKMLIEFYDYFQLHSGDNSIIIAFHRRTFGYFNANWIMSFSKFKSHFREKSVSLKFKCKASYILNILYPRAIYNNCIPLRTPTLTDVLKIASTGKPFSQCRRFSGLFAFASCQDIKYILFPQDRLLIINQSRMWLFSLFMWITF